ncbi:dentin sialophosphoprotein-like [Teleopsis dalmanni]|uniref:dentin sialophosphoprotein-like n=1 Tax=Teleopsis dalmanni TaxID=139649 RepID=UPI0018CCCB02|nr:dentin sialophosphoprotein-like [Teleopsis dalmanni]
MNPNRNRRDRNRRNRPVVRSTVRDNLGSDGEYDEDTDDMCDSPIDWFAESEFDERLLDPKFFVKFITNTDEKPKKHSDHSHQFRHPIIPRELLSTGSSSSYTMYSTPSTDYTDSTDNTASSSAGNTNPAINISSYESGSSQNSPENTDESGPQCSTIFSNTHSANNASSNSDGIATSRSESSRATNASDTSSLGLTNDEMIALGSLISTMGLFGVTASTGSLTSNSGDINSSLDALSGLFNGLSTSESVTSNDNVESNSTDSDVEN